MGCQKCEVTGEYHRMHRRMSFPKIDCTRRTNESFRFREQKQHHKKERSPFEQLNIDMIRDFPVSDSLHLLDLGIMRKCMHRWIFGAKGYSRKWSKAVFSETSNLLEKCAPYMPTDIHRKLRDLNCINRWKGIEYRSVLLYVGMIVFKQALPSYEYYHFLILSCAVTICSCKVYENRIPFAGDLFKKYVQLYGEIYGTDTITSNVHNLVHIVEDMSSLKISNLIEISTYKFENCLRLLGLKVKQCNLPLEQAARRVTEMSKIQLAHMNTNIHSANRFSPKVYYQKQDGNRIIYDKIEVKPDVMFSNRKVGDSWFLARSNDDKIQIVKVLYVTVDANQYRIWGSPLKQLQNFFTYPITSTKLNIYESDGEMDNPIFWNIKSIMAKMICLPYDQRFVYMPILHTLEILKFSE